MGSRRTMNHSLSGSGRPLNGSEVSGNSRSPGCSYLSNVRPENRSTLCSVIAQLTEETQPFFEVTLKSKAVSQSCSAKFTCNVNGHPTPQITWYKDDVQLDRYCGLPKYEILRNGPNHSLHIYHCTEEDAAIYQASATNTKGIVSCSGVLEVGEMNEFKIHQRYFSKLKQKAENKRKEAEEKENHEPTRTISPDRTQRKRRSTVGGYISAPSSTEDDTSDESQQEVAAGISEVSSRVQESCVEAFTYTNGTVESLEPHLSTDREAKEDTPLIGTHDSAQKVIPGVPQTKTPLVKKCKIFNKAKAGSEEKKVCEKEGNISMTGLETPKSPIKSRNVVNSMEVENSTVSTSLKSLKRRVTSICTKPGANMEKGDCKASKVNVKEQNGHASNNFSSVIPPRTSKLQSPQLTIKQETSAIPKVIDRDKKARCLSPDTTSPPDTSCDTSPASPQPPRQQVTQEPPQKGTRPDQKSGGVPVSEQRMEATQPHAESQRNEAPVDLELQPELQAAVAPETTPCKKTERDRRGASLHRGFQKAKDNVTQDKQGPSMGSNKISLDLSPSTQKLPFKGSRTAENKSKCDVFPTAQQGKTKTPISTVGGEETQHEKIKSAETTTGVLQLKGGTQHEESSNVLEENNEEIVKNIEEIPGDLKKEEKHSSSEECVQVPLGGHFSLQPEEHTQVINKSDMQSEPTDLKKCPSPIPNIISIAELLRSQINALEDSVSPQTAATNNPTGKSVDVESNCIKTNKDPLADQGPPQSIKETLLLIYNELIKTRNLFVDETPVLSNCTQPINATEIPSLIAPKVTICSERNDQKATTDLPERASESNGYTLEVRHEPEESVNTDAPRLTQEKHCQSLLVEETQAATIETAKTNLEDFPVVEVKETFSLPLMSKTEELTSNMSNTEIVQEIPVPSDLEDVDSLRDNNIAIEDVETVMVPQLIPQTSPGLEKRKCDSIPAATPQELASGARRKVLSHKNKLEEPLPINNSSNPIAVNVSTSPQPSGHSVLLLPNVESPKTKRSPLLSRKKSPADVPNPPTSELPNEKPEEANKAKNDPYRAPQVIRKIRGEPFADHCGNMKLWCQFFNVLCESTVTWFRDGHIIASILKSAGDETQVNLALAQATSLDAGVYGCTISNEYGTDSTDFLLSAEVLRGMSLREDLGVGEEIELTPLIFNKGMADTCVWGNKLFGRIMVQESRLGVGFSHKTWRAKVIYGLEPVFESGKSCIIKVCNPIGYGGKSEGLLTQNNQEGVKQACQFQNLVREYCKIFSTEARGIDNFGSFLEVIPVYMLYRPANSIPYATVETDLTGVFSRYCGLDHTGKLDMRSGSEVEQKCCALMHWIFQWTNGNMLFTRLEGVDFKITNIRISVKSHGHQGLPLEGNPKIFEQFVIQHQCNYYCGLLGLRSLKVIESLLMPTKPRSSKSPLLQRKLGPGSSSPQTGRKTSASPRTSKKILIDGHRSPSEQSPADESKDKLSTSHQTVIIVQEST